MASYEVMYSLQGTIVVEADTPEDAEEKVKALTTSELEGTIQEIHIDNVQEEE